MPSLIAVLLWRWSHEWAERGIILVTGSNGSIGTAVMGQFAGRFTGVVGFDHKAPSDLIASGSHKCSREPLTPGSPSGTAVLTVSITSHNGHLK